MPGDLDRTAVLVGDQEDDVLLGVLAKTGHDVRGLVGGTDEFDAARNLGDLAMLDEGRELAVDIEDLEVVERSLAGRAHRRIRSGRRVLRLALAGVGRSGPAHAEIILAGIGTQAGFGLQATTGGRKLRSFVDGSGRGLGSFLRRCGHVGRDADLRAHGGLGGAIGLGDGADCDLAGSTAELADELAGDGLPVVDLALGHELRGGFTGGAQAALDGRLGSHLAGL